MIFTEKMQSQKMGSRDYIQALEEERRKIEVFQRELPLCLELVNQAIDMCRQQLSGITSECNLNGQSESSEQTSTEGPVLEVFIPIKKRESPDCDENDDEDEQHSHKPKISRENKNTDKKKSDWLRSVQLWNPDPTIKEDVPRKAAVEVKRNGGAFQPFQREENSRKANVLAGKAPASSPVAATSSTAGPVIGGGNGGNNKKEEKDGQRKQRRCWSPELHKRFLHALQQLGGPDSATPKQIRELIKVDGLTNDEVKSHLQKYRLHTRRPAPMLHNNANPQAAPFVLVGNIFVQPPEYAAAVATTSTAASEVTTATAPVGIYAPVAAYPPTVAHKPTPLISKPRLKQLEHSEFSHSEERSNHSEGAVHSNSPASSSSTHTTTNC